MNQRMKPLILPPRVGLCPGAAGLVGEPVKPHGSDSYPDPKGGKIIKKVNMSVFLKRDSK